MTPARDSRSFVSIVLTLTMLVPSILVGLSATAAAASGSGVQVVTDPAGDSGAAGAAGDVLRLGASSDATQIHYYTLVTDHTAAHPDINFEIDFTVGALSYFAKSTYGANGALTVNSVYTKAGVVGASGKPMTVAWVGDELKMDINRADINSPADSSSITAIQVLTWPPSSSTTTYDSTGTGSYVVGSAAVNVPGAPTNLQAAAGNGLATLSWNAPTSDGGAAVSNYDVYRGTSSGGESLLASTGGANATFRDQTVANGVTYYYKVAAVNSAGVGAQSVEASVVPTAAPQVPGAPASLVATAGDKVATLLWAPPVTAGSTPITAYKVYRGTASGAEALVATVGNVLTLGDSGLADGTTYYYQVSAVNSVGEGARSVEATATPLAPASLSFTLYRGPTLVQDVGEGSIGVDWKTGNVMMNGNINGLQQGEVRVTFDDARSPPAASWTSVTPPDATLNLDPMLFTDAITGRTFAGGLLPYCSHFDYTDNDGQTWLPVGNDCTTASDHETIGGGPFVNAVLQKSPLYNHTVYYCADSATPLVGDPGLPAQADCAVSYDGGVTFNGEVPLPCSDLMGHIRVGPDGTAYLPNKDCVPTVSAPVVEISSNDGVSWTQVRIPGTTSPPRADSSDPSVAAGRGDKYAGGRVYYAIQDASGKMLVATSTDKGQTWTSPVDISSRMGVTATTFPEVIAGDDDRAAVEFLGTKDATSATQPFEDGFHGVWHAYVGVTYDGGVTWTVQDLTPSDPVQLGKICLGGTGCSGGRNLLDFNDITMDARGRVLGEFADGCVDSCVTTFKQSGESAAEGLSTTAWGTIARLTSGNGLLAQYDTTSSNPLHAAPGGAYSGAAGSKTTLHGSATGGLAPYSFSWSVASAPAGSAGGAFTDTGSPTGAFQPDRAGPYALRLTVTDASGAQASDVASFVADTSIASRCASGGVIVAVDSGSDEVANGAGAAAEATCLRAGDDAQTLDLYADLKGTSVDSNLINANSQLFYDFYLTLGNAGGNTLVLEASYDGSSAPTASFYTTDFVPIPGLSANAAFVGNTLHVSTARSNLAAPSNGAVLGLYLDINHAVGSGLSSTIVHDDYVPDSQDGSYTFGASGATGGVPPPDCSIPVASDLAGDSTMVGPGAGMRDGTALAASDDINTLKLCLTVKDMTDGPSGAPSATTDTRYGIFWMANYEGPQIGYSAQAVLQPDHTLAKAPIVYKGVCTPATPSTPATTGSPSCETLNGQAGPEKLGGSATAVVQGNTLVLSIDKSVIGAPGNGGKATGWIAQIQNDNGNTPTTFDKMPNTGTGADYTFGTTVGDTTAPTQVTGVSVADPRSGSALAISWSAASDNVGVTQYDVLRATSASGPYALVGVPSGSSYTDTGLTTGTTYWYEVEAQDASGNVGPASAAASGTPTSGAVADTTPPTAPSGLVASGTTQSSVSLTWAAASDPESGVASYDVYRNGALLASTTTTTFTDAGLLPSTTYGYAVSAVNGAGLEGAKSATLSVTTLGATGPTVSITDPTSGAVVTPPKTFAGTFTTTGQAANQNGAHAAKLPWNTELWANSAGVKKLLGSAAFSSAQQTLAALPGYLAALPTTSGDITVLLSGAVPTGAPTSVAGLSIRYADNTTTQTLMAPAKHAANALTIDEFVAWAKANPQLTGPMQPGIQTGIGPGTALQMGFHGNAPAWICTASFLTEDPATHAYYLVTAGHCLLDVSAGATDSLATPQNTATEVDLCVSGCIDNWLGVGTYVKVQATSAFNPVAYAHQNGVGDDVGLIRIPTELYPYLRPYMWFWAGPNTDQAQSASDGDRLLHWGHGVLVGATPASQGRAAVSITGGPVNFGGQLPNAFQAVGSINGGDSGSAIELAKVDAANKLVGGPAMGIITHTTLQVDVPLGCVGPAPCLGAMPTPGEIFFGTDLHHALHDMAAPHLGFEPRVVQQDATILLAGAGNGPQLAAAFTSPGEGSQVSASQAVDITGTATFPIKAASGGTQTITYYPQRTGCGSTNGDILSFQTMVQASSYVGGCSLTEGPAGVALDTAGAPISEDYPALAALASPLLLDATRQVDATVDLICVHGNAANPECAPSAVNDLELQLYGGNALIGSARVKNALIIDGPTHTGPTPVQFAFTPLVSYVPAGTVLRMHWIVHEAAGPAGMYYTGNPATTTRVVIPVGTPAANSVQLALDSAFTQQLTVTGDSSWAATIPPNTLSAGAHEIFARALQDGAPQSSAPATLNLTVVSTSHTPPTAAFTSNVSGLTASFTDASVAGDSAIATRSWDFGDGSALGSGTAPTHTYASAGTFHVTLTVTDANGLSSVATHDIKTTSAPSWQVQTRLADPNGNDAIAWTTVAAPQDGATGTWSAQWSPSGVPAAGTYTLYARLIENGAAVSNASVAFTVPVIDHLPTVNAGSDITVDESTPVTLHATASDPDANDTLTYQWTQTAGPSLTLSGATTSDLRFTPPDLNADATYAFHVVVDDGRGGTASDDVNVTARDVPHLTVDTVNGQALAQLGALANTANVAGSESVPGGATSDQPPVAAITDVHTSALTLTASGATSSDPDGTIVAYAWDLGNGAHASGATLSYTYPAAGTYDIALTVTDNAGVMGNAHATVTVAQPAAAKLVVDAGDSKFQLVGQPLAASARALGAQGAVSFQWDLDGAQTQTGQSVSFDTTGLSAGAHTLHVGATDASGQVASDSVPVDLYALTTTSKEFQNDVTVGVPDEGPGNPLPGASGAVDGATFFHDVTVPAGARLLHADLTWQNYEQVYPANPVTGTAGGVDDFDLFVHSPNGAQDTQSAGSQLGEHVDISGPDAGAWQFEVRSYVAVKDTYSLFVNTTSAPLSPLPTVDQTSQVCFTTGTQQLQATATKNASGAWDLDGDGVFETSGLAATTSFAVGSGAHLVSFRATTSDGYRATILVAVRVEAQCANAPSVVVIGVSDTGINPYSQEFAGELMPYAALRDFTTADPSNLGPGDVVVRHHVTNAVLPFTKNPASYIPGFPAGARPLTLTLGGGDYQGLDAATWWQPGHGTIPLDQWYWIPGTKIVGAIDGGDSKPINGAADNIPILDEDGHGTASVSVAAGNTVGSCPRCVIAFAEDFSGGGIDLLEKQPWIDFVSVSGGALENVGTPGLTDESVSKAAAERGQVISFAAGNGGTNTFTDPEQTYTSDWSGPAWTIRVGAVQKDTQKVILGTGKPVDWSSYGLGDIPAACKDSYGAGCEHSGTSAATPLSTGYLANALLEARIAIGDSNAGQKPGMALAVGTPISGSPALRDGTLTRSELVDAAFHCASGFGPATSIGGTIYLVPPVGGVGPASPVDFAYGGRGIADGAMSTCTASALVNGAPVHSTPNADLFYTVDGAIRDQLWGSWSSGSASGPATFPSLAGLKASDVDTLGKASHVIRGVYKDLGIVSGAPAPTESYYLHATGGCPAQGEVYSMDMRNSGGDDGCFGFSVGANPTSTFAFPSTVTTNGFASGATVSGTVYVQYAHPNAATVTVTLKSNGASVLAVSSQKVPALSDFVGATGTYVAYPFTGTLANAVPSGATLELDVSVSGASGVAVGYGSGHTSGFTLTGPASGGGSGDKATAAITSPAQGQHVQAPNAVTISGTAAFPPSSASVPTKEYLHWDAGATPGSCGASYMNEQDTPDGGEGCQQTIPPAGPFAAAYEFPYQGSAGSLSLTPGGHVKGAIYVGSLGPTAAQYLLVLKNGATVLGSQPATLTHVDAFGTQAKDKIDVDFALDGLTTTAPLTALTFEFQDKQDPGNSFIELESPASYVTLPVHQDVASAQSVQVALDDGTFATGRLGVTGTSAWTATWDLTNVAAGAHTIYARASQDGAFGDITSVGVVVDAAQQQTGGHVPDVQVQAVPSGAIVDGASWKATTLNKTSGAWSYAWDTFALRNGAWDFHVRLLSDGVEAKQTVFTATLANSGRAPTLASIPAQAGNESQPIGFGVTADDLDNDALTLAATNLPGGATFTDHGDGTGAFSWTPTYSQAGDYAVTFTATDSTGKSATTNATIHVRNVNRAPTLAPIPDQSVPEGSTLTLALNGSDPDGGVLTYSMSGSLPGSAFDATSGVLSWTPGYTQHGNYTATFTVTDDQGATASRVANITVTDVNAPPTITVSDKAIAEGSTLQFVATATDPDNDPTTIGAPSLPPGATFDAATSTFRWTPNYDQAGAYTATFNATDGVNLVTKTINVTVSDTNRPPTLPPIGDKTVAAGSTLSFALGASDPDGDAITNSATNLPNGSTFDASTGTFTWVPTKAQAGSYPNVGFHVADTKGATTSRSITITVSAIDHAPVVDSIANQTVNENATLAFTATASDVDGDTVTFHATSLPVGATLTSAGAFTWTPTFDQAGAYTIEVVGTDGQLNASATVNVTVVNVDRAPTVAAAKATIVELANGTLSVSGGDPDGDAVTLSVDAATLPSFATFTPLAGGKGRLDVSPGLGAAGTYDVTIIATANALTGQNVARIVVLQDSAFTVTIVGTNAPAAVPGKALTLTANVTNVGPETDTIGLTATQTARGWTLVAPASPVTLAPRESRLVTFTVTPPGTGTSDNVVLTGASQANPGSTHKVTWSVTVPVVVTLTFSKDVFAPIDDISGVVNVTYADGSPIANAPVQLEQSLNGTSQQQLKSTVKLKTDASGSAAFDFGAGTVASLPGEHKVIVSVTTLQGLEHALGSYAVGVPPPSAPTVPTAPAPPTPPTPPTVPTPAPPTVPPS